MSSVDTYCNEVLMCLVLGLFPGFDNPDRLFIVDESMFLTSCDRMGRLGGHRTDLPLECSS